MGLITTNSLTMVFNRRVLQAALEGAAHLDFAVPDHPWVDGANGPAVRIAMTVVTPGAGEGRLLTVTQETPGAHGEMDVVLAEQSGLVHADLSVGANVAAAGRCRLAKVCPIEGMNWATRVLSSLRLRSLHWLPPA